VQYDRVLKHYPGEHDAFLSVTSISGRQAASRGVWSRSVLSRIGSELAAVSVIGLARHRPGMPQAVPGTRRAGPPPSEARGRLPHPGQQRRAPAPQGRRDRSPPPGQDHPPRGPRP
jgi:hypothetical protein